MPPESKKKPSPKRLHNNRLAKSGEQRATDYLQKQGWVVLERNYRDGQDEIDIVARDMYNQELVFVEVKTRSHDYAGHPSLAVDKRKLQALIRAGQRYVGRQHWSGDYRFDLLTVLPDTVEHFINITFP